MPGGYTEYNWCGLELARRVRIEIRASTTGNRNRIPNQLNLTACITRGVESRLALGPWGNREFQMINSPAFPATETVGSAEKSTEANSNGNSSWRISH